MDEISHSRPLVASLGSGRFLDTKSIQAVVFDLDGVIWLGDSVVPGAPEAVSELRAAGIQIRFFTNNASRHRCQYVEKLASMRISASTEEVISSGYAAARFLVREYGSCAVHVMGSQGLRDELLEAGHTLVDRQSQAVVVGYDREFTWLKLDAAFQNIFVDGARFIACNQDRRYVEQDCFRPGTGATVASLAYSLEREPDVVIGKPHQPIIDALLESLSSTSDDKDQNGRISPAQCLLVGDKLYTDVLAGHRAGMLTMLVRSGHGSEEEKRIGDIRPDSIIDSVADLPRLLLTPRD